MADTEGLLLMESLLDRPLSPYLSDTLGEEREDEVLTMMRRRYRDCEQAESALREQQRDDQQFRAGQQWKPQDEAARLAAKRPCLTINTTQQYEGQIVNEVRRNLPALRVLPVGNGADRETAKVLQGILRHIEQRSHAGDAYITAVENAGRIGRGFFRIRLAYENQMSFEQEILIERLRNPFQVLLDHHAQDFCGRDARYGFIAALVDKQQHQMEYGFDTASMASWGSADDTWMLADQIRETEYFFRDPVPMTLVLLDDGSTHLLEPLLLGVGEDTEKLPQLEDGVKRLVTPERGMRLLPWMRQQAAEAGGWLAAVGQDFAEWYLAQLQALLGRVVQARKTYTERIWHLKTNGHVILEESLWPGRYIPILPVIGTEIDLNGQVDYSGFIRNAKDPMRMTNYWEPLALDTPVPTPDGWATIGEVKTGDTVFDEQGMPCQVLGTSPTYTDRACYRVHFNDGSSIVADAGHLWTVEEQGKRRAEGRVWTSRTVPTSALEPRRHTIVTPLPLELPKQDLPIHPYVLGVWLGDGTAHCPEVNVGAQDLDALRETLDECGVTLGRVRRSGAACWKFTLLGLRKHFAAMGLLDNKHIPPIYLRASYEQRLALLQGLMDTDGTMGRLGACDFTTTSLLLRDGMAELLRTLGLKAVWHLRQRPAKVFHNGKTYCPSLAYQFAFSVYEGITIFRLPRKVARQLRTRPFHARRTKRYRIVAVEAVPPVPVRCIAVANASHLFLVGRSMVPTHNTMRAEHIALAPPSPWLVAEGQLEGYEDDWKAANRVPFASLTWKPVVAGGALLPPPQRNVYEPPIQAITLAMQSSQEQTQAAIGIYRASLGAPSPERSGKAIVARDQQADTGTFHYSDNLRRAIQYCGEQLIDLLQNEQLMPPEKVQRILGDDNSASMVFLKRGMQPDEQLPGDVKGIDGIYDISVGRYDVIVTTGPGYETKRQEAVESVVEVGKMNPKVAELGADILVGHIDLEGMDELARRIKKTLPPELQDETPEGGEADPEAQVAQLQAQAQADGQQLEVLNAYAQECEAKLEQATAELQEAQATQDLKERELQLKEQEAAWRHEEAMLRLALERQKLGMDREETRDASANGSL